jgi:hypothetical protein
VTETWLVLGVLTAGGIAYLVRNYVTAFLISGALTLFFALMQMMLGNVGCRFSPGHRLYNPIEQAIYALPLAVVVGMVAALFAYALKLYEARQ